MNQADTPSKSRETPGRLAPNDVSLDDEATWEAYGVSLTPTTPDSLVTWDVSRHARRDQERVRFAASQIPATTPGE